MVYVKLAIAVLLGATGVEAQGSFLRASASSYHRKLSFESIAGYEPRSLVTDHNAIDLDQAEMEKQLSLSTTESFAKAKDIYTSGAFSKSIARITLSSPLIGPLKEDTVVVGKTKDQVDVGGTLLANYPTGTTVIDIQYKVNTAQNNYVGCQVGKNPNPNTERCFAASGQLVIESGGSSTFAYTYAPLTNNINKRTLQGFSTKAEDKMYRCSSGNCPFVTYEKFYQYYGEFDYADKWVSAAFDGGRTSFSNGNADFGNYGSPGRTEAIKKGTAYMSVWMYVIHEMEDAIDDCEEGCSIENCNDDPVHSWDEAVAFYSGSLESTDGQGSGVMLHQLADKRCSNFNTCGDLASETSGISHVNLEIFREFRDGQRKLSEGKCPDVRANKERIEKLMTIPIVQGTIRYAYISAFEFDAGERAEAEGAVFAAAVLPLVHYCNEEAAQTIHDNMKTGKSGSADFQKVKAAFEQVYSCMGIRCEDVGGLYADGTGYRTHAEPCSSQFESSDEANVGLIVGISIGSLVTVGLLAYFRLWQKQKK